MKTDKPTMLMFAAHEPTDDPRVGWAAEATSMRFDTIVVGFHNAGSGHPDLETIGESKVIRVARDSAVRKEFVARLATLTREYLGKRFELPSVPSPVAFVSTACLVAMLAILEIGGRGICLVMQLLAKIFPSASISLARKMISPKRKALHSETMSSQASTAGNASPTFMERMLMWLWTLKHVILTAQRFWREANAIESRVDAVYCHDLDTLLAGVLVAVRHGCPLIYDSHEYWPYSNVQALKAHVKFFLAYERFLIRRATYVITVSEPLARELERVYGIKKVFCVPNAEPWIEQGVSEDFSGEMDRLAAGRVKFLFQGSFAPERGLEELVRAWKDVDASGAVLFLRGPKNQWRDSIEAIAESIGLLNHSIFVLPPLAVEQLVNGAREADVGVIPYKTDSPAYRFACPNKLSQYLHAGTAILSSNIPYVESMVKAGGFGATYDAHVHTSIVEAIGSIACDREKLKNMQRNAREYGRTVFNWQVQSRELTSIVNACAEMVTRVD